MPENIPEPAAAPLAQAESDTASSARAEPDPAPSAQAEPDPAPPAQAEPGPAPSAQAEPWMRGPMPGIHTLIAPLFYSFQMAREDLARWTEGLATEQIWATP